MRLILLVLFFTSLFACEHKDIKGAYNEYMQSKQNYIEALLDHDKPSQIFYLRKIVTCGHILDFDVRKYQKVLNKKLPSLSDFKVNIKDIKKEEKILSRPKKKKIIKKHTKPKPKFQNPLKIESDYINFINDDPIEVELSSKMKVKYSNFYAKKSKVYYYIFEIKNAKLRDNIVKKINNYEYKIIRYTQNSIRLVITSKQSLNINYSVKNKLLFVNILSQNPKPKKYVYKVIHYNKIVVIDPGHGGKDPGGIGYNHIKEKNIVLPIAKDLKRELVKRGYKVYLTRKSDKFITLKDRTTFANHKHADLFVSLHCNIAPKHPEVYGIETYFLSPARSDRAKKVAKLENSAIGNLRTTTQNIVLNFLNKNKIIDSTKLALDIQKSLIYNLKKHYNKIKDGGVRPAPFWVLVGSSMPAILIETGFISNKREALRLVNKTYQKRYAKYIADGIDNYFRKNP